MKLSDGENRRVALRVGLATLFLGSALAVGRGPDKAGGRRPPPPHHPPPPSALTACTGKTAGTKCEFEGRRGQEIGACEATPDGKYFACKPDHGPGDDRKGPPPDDAKNPMPKEGAEPGPGNLPPAKNGAEPL